MTSSAALEQLLDTARSAAAAAAGIALGWQHSPGALRIQEKAAADDLVSQADRDAEEAARAVIATRRPSDAVLGEESGATSGGSGVRWVIDPIDGTMSYLYGRPDWAVSVAAVDEADGRVLAAAVAEPALGRMSYARAGGGAWQDGVAVACRECAGLERAVVEVNFGTPAQRPLAGALIASLVGRVRDVRRGGSAAAALAQLASGRVDAYWGPGLQEWDGAAGLLLAAEAGALVGDLTGRRGPTWPSSGNVLAAVPQMWEPLHAILARVYGVSGAVAPAGSRGRTAGAIG